MQYLISNRTCGNTRHLITKTKKPERSGFFYCVFLVAPPDPTGGQLPNRRASPRPYDPAIMAYLSEILLPFFYLDIVYKLLYPLLVFLAAYQEDIARFDNYIPVEPLEHNNFFIGNIYD